jgi:DNA-binding SARP family transcriptional activator
MIDGSDKPRASLFLLGRWNVEATPALGHPIGDAARRAIALLALRGPMTRSQIAGTIWPESTEEAANARLRTALWRMKDRHALLDDRDRALSLRSDVWVDVVELRSVALMLENDSGGPDGCDGAHVFTAESFGSDLLPGWYDDWLVVDRERIRELRIHALEALTARWTRLGRYAAAVDTGLVAVRSDPLRESAYRCLIAAHLAHGNLGAAVRQYESCRCVFRKELGIEPSETLAAMLPMIGFSHAVR